MAKSKQKKRKRDRKTDVIIGELNAKEKKRKSGKIASACNDQSNKSSLVQLLKKHRGVAANTAPPLIWIDDDRDRRRNFLTPQDDPKSFDACLRTSFYGFFYDSPEALPSSLHRGFDSSFGGMDRGGLFLYDMVQPGKRRLTRTSVTRTLVGDPGSTYKYLGLRLFSHPWVDVDQAGNAMNKEQSEQTNGSTLRKLGYSGQATSALMMMGKINATLVKRSKFMLQEHVAAKVKPEGLVGSADFNLTLVNKMEPTSTKRDMKKEVAYGMGKISVGWHRDSGLKDFSSIAVYQLLKEVKNSHDSWGVALRAMNGGDGGPIENVPALLVPLPSGSLYYMLDEFNHNHEHAVIAGSGGIRYSSTHRVAREGRGTYQYIRDKIHKFQSTASDFDSSKGIVTASNLSLRKRRDKLVSHVRACQNIMTEIEFEWLRQWFVQGQKHASLHPYWHSPIDMLCDSFCEFERESHEVINLLANLSKRGVGESDVTENLFDVLIEAITERSKLRALWHERYRDPVFCSIPADERPFPCPCLDRQRDNEGHMPENLGELVLQLRKWRSAFVANSEEDNDGGSAKGTIGKKKKKKEKKGSLTKKEVKGRASNWERLKARLKG